MYITMNDFEDELLMRLMQQSDIDAADAAVEQLAINLDVDVSNIKTDPLNVRVKEYALAYAYERRAGLKMGANPKSHQGTDGEDAYGVKRKVYAKKIEYLEATITEQMLTGAKKADDNFFCMTMGRC